MKILIYAGSLRPGGGLTVLKNIVEGLAKDKRNEIIVYSGAKDASAQISKLSNTHYNVIQKRFSCFESAKARYFFSKLFFLVVTLFKRFDYLRV